MHIKSIAAAAITAALMAFATVPASANTNTSDDAAAGNTLARFDAPATSSYCGCRSYRYVRYYRVRYVRYYYRYYY
jgi:hypothetical protein